MDRPEKDGTAQDMLTALCQRHAIKPPNALFD
jgi:hypothetical protein